MSCIQGVVQLYGTDNRYGDALINPQRWCLAQWTELFACDKSVQETALRAATAVLLVIATLVSAVLGLVGIAIKTASTPQVQPQPQPQPQADRAEDRRGVREEQRDPVLAGEYDVISQTPASQGAVLANLPLDRGLSFSATRVLGDRAILCDPPCRQSRSEFWRVVWESNADSIIMLADMSESDFILSSHGRRRGVVHTPAYWPAVGETEVQGESGVSVRVVSEERCGPHEYFARRELSISKDGITRNVVHLQCRRWLRNMDPSIAQQLIQAHRAARQADCPYVVHGRRHWNCMNAAGRKKAYAVLEEAIDRRSKGDAEPRLVYNVARELGSHVGSYDQYRMINQVFNLG